MSLENLNTKLGFFANSFNEFIKSNCLEIQTYENNHLTLASFKGGSYCINSELFKMINERFVGQKFELKLTIQTIYFDKNGNKSGMKEEEFYFG